MQVIISTVKWFDFKKGYGFIELEDSEDIFVHYSEIQMPVPGFRTLNAGDRVTFRVEKTKKGLQAKDVILIESCKIK